METKNQIFERYKKEYFALKAKRNRAGQTRILTTVIEIVHMTRKAAIRKFSRLQNRDPWKQQGERRGRKTYYTADAISALQDIWGAANGSCAELLHPMAHEYIEIFIRDTMWKHSDEATDKLFAMSLGTMKALIRGFFKARRKGRGFSLTSPSNLKHIIPVFRGPWDSELPGSGQIDTVAHCGSTLLGYFIYTLNYVDIPTLWDIAHAQWNKGQEATVRGIDEIRGKLPFPLHKIHPDTGSEFINWHCKAYCDTNAITMSRSRPNHKNDNAYVEERNGHIVRKYVGYIRLDCREAVEALNNLYVVLCPYLNHFIASRKCLDKVKIGSKYKKIYEPIAKTPYQRVLESEHIEVEVKEKLRQEHAKLNPLVMKKEIDRLREVLYDVQRKHGNRQF